MTQINIVVNNIQFEEIVNDFFIVHGEEDKFPFINSVYQNRGLFKIRRYKSLAFNGKFFAPKIK